MNVAHAPQPRPSNFDVAATQKKNTLKMSQQLHAVDDVRRFVSADGHSLEFVAARSVLNCVSGLDLPYADTFFSCN